MRKYAIVFLASLISATMSQAFAQSLFGGSSNAPAPTVTRSYPVPKPPTVMNADQFSSAVTTLDKANKQALKSSATDSLNDSVPTAKNANNNPNGTPASSNSTKNNTTNSDNTQTNTSDSSNDTSGDNNAASTPSTSSPANLGSDKNTQSKSGAGFNIKY